MDNLFGVSLYIRFQTILNNAQPLELSFGPKTHLPYMICEKSFGSWNLAGCMLTNPSNYFPDH